MKKKSTLPVSALDRSVEVVALWGALLSLCDGRNAILSHGPSQTLEAYDLRIKQTQIRLRTLIDHVRAGLDIPAIELGVQVLNFQRSLYGVDLTPNVGDLP